MTDLRYYPIFRGYNHSEGMVEGNLFIPMNHHKHGVEEVYIIPFKKYYDDPQPQYIVDENTLEMSPRNTFDENGNRLFYRI